MNISILTAVLTTSFGVLVDVQPSPATPVAVCQLRFLEEQTGDGISLMHIRPHLILSKRIVKSDTYTSKGIKISLMSLTWRSDRIEWAALSSEDCLFGLSASWDLVYHSETKRIYAIELRTQPEKYTLNVYEIKPFGLNDLKREIDHMTSKEITADTSPFNVMPTSVYHGKGPKQKRPVEGDRKQDGVWNPKATATENGLTIRFSRCDESEPIAVSYSFKTKKWSEKE